MKTQTDKEKQFLSIIDSHRRLVTKVCWLYVSADTSFDDLYQEVLVNIWQGMDSFRGEAKLSTWIHRTAINTCITWYRRNSRHSGALRLDDMAFDPADNRPVYTADEDMRELYRLISMLGPVDKALITLWLDEKPYDEIASIMGMTQTNVAVRLHRIKDRLSKLAER